MKAIIETLFDGESERGVSPVIGVILMVAITVILAAVIGTFVLNLSKQTGNVAPKATFSFQDADDSFTNSTAGANAGPNGNDSYFRLKQTGGEDLKMGDLKVVIRNPDTSAELASFNETNSYNTTGMNITYNSLNSKVGTGQTISNGDSLFIVENSKVNDVDTGLKANTEYSIEIIHEPTGKAVDSGTITLK